MADRTRQERIFTFLLLPAIAVGVLVLTGVTFRTSFQVHDTRRRSELIQGAISALEPHDTYVYLFAEHGVVGLSLFLLTMYLFWRPIRSRHPGRA